MNSGFFWVSYYFKMALLRHFDFLSELTANLSHSMEKLEESVSLPQA